MKIFSLLLSALFLSAGLHAQDTWKVYYGKQELLSSTTHDEQANRIVLGSATIKPDLSLAVTYIDRNPTKDWVRKMMIYDSKDNLLMVKENARVIKLSADELKDLHKKHGSLRFFTMALPSDPEQAALVRVARLHLCTVELKP